MPLSNPPAFRPSVPPVTIGAAGTVLTSNGLTAATPPTFQVPAAGASGANPSASLGLTAVNGVLTTFLRSDGAPALDQSISPVMTGLWTFSSTEPRLLLNETDQGANLKLWDIDVSAGVMAWRTRTDADGAGVNVIAATRGATTALANLSFGNAANNPTFTFLGTGTITLTNPISSSATALFSAVTGTRFIPNGNTVPTIGIYAPNTNVLGFSTATTLRGQFDTVGQFRINTLGAGLSIAEGANAKMGTAVLVGGTVVVATTAVTANSRILLTAQVLGTVAVASALAVTARTAGTSFTITAAVATDTSTIAWILFEPS